MSVATSQGRNSFLECCRSLGWTRHHIADDADNVDGLTIAALTLPFANAVPKARPPRSCHDPDRTDRGC